MKRLDAAKGRLGSEFGAAARARIAAALVEDALALCGRATFLRWWVLSDDDSVLARARAEGLAVLRDEAPGLNAALRRALARLRRAGARSATVVPADVPLATPEDVRTVVAAGREAAVVICPARDGGTNALFTRPPGAIDPVFGSNSCVGHERAARAAGLATRIVRLPRVELDVDTGADADALLRTAPAREGHAARALAALRAD